MQIQKVKYEVKEVMGELVITQSVEVDVCIQKTDDLKDLIKAIKSVLKPKAQ